MTSPITWKLLKVSRIAAMSAVAVALALALYPRASGARQAQAASASASLPHIVAADSVLWMDMENVDLHIDVKNVMRIRSLHGRVMPTQPGAIAWLDDAKSFVIHATSGSVSLDGDAVTALLDGNIFDYPGAPIKKLHVKIEDGYVVQTGILHKGVDIPFEMKSVPRLEPDGRLKLHPDHLKIFGVNGLALMHALHLHLESMMDLSKAHGASVKGDDIFLDPLAIIPPPSVKGTLSAVRIQGNLLVQDFARTADDTVFGTFVRADPDAHNYIYFRGGLLRFGKLTMTDTDLLIHDADESDPFDLYFKEYNKQLIAGHTKNLANFGLRTWMVDYGKLGGERTVAEQRK